MNNLRKPIYSLIKPIVEAVDKDENSTSASLLNFCGESPVE
jgi:hypothetical protein